jgi:hypothetical protein
VAVLAFNVTMIEEDGLAVPVDPGRDDPEVVESRAGGPGAFVQVEVNGLPVKRQNDLPAPGGGRR